MSDTAPVPALLVTHAGLGRALVEAAASIAGDAAGLTVLSNEGLSRDDLLRAIAAQVAAFGPGGGLVFADVQGGSCAQASVVAAARHSPGPVVVICGVNLPMLLDYLHNRGNLGPVELAERVVARGRASILQVQAPQPAPPSPGGAGAGT